MNIAIVNVANFPHVDYSTASREALDYAIRRSPEHLRPPLFATRDQNCRFMFVAQGQRPFDVPTDRPAILLLGDDLFEALGPAGFHETSLRNYLTRCSAAAIIACEPVPKAYAAPCTNAVLLRQDVAIIETRPERGAEWLDLLRELRPAISVLMATVRPEGSA